MAGNTQQKRADRPPNTMMLRRTLWLLALCGIVSFAVLAARLVKLQLIDHVKYESYAIEQQVRETTVSATRGAIYDRNRKILAMSASVETIYISPAEIKMYNEPVDIIAGNLSRILDVDYDKIVEMAGDTKSWYKTVARKVEEETADEVRAFKNEYGLKGVKIENDTKRYYPYGSLASHVVGYVGSENTGLAGIELVMDSALSGVTGRIVRAKNARGTDMLFTKYEDYYDSEDGRDVVLTIDSTIQYYLEKHLQKAVEDYGVHNGAAAIAMAPATGEILGMVSLGNFNLNAYQDVSDEVKAILGETEDVQERQSILSEAQQRQWRNKALSDTYEPGSTFKIITLAMALEEGVAHMDDQYYCGGYIEVIGDSPGHGRHCWKTIGHGSQSLTQSLQHSCNVAFIQLGQALGPERFYKYVRAFGFFQPTGLELPGESSSIWWPESIFYAPDNRTQLAAASFGQTFNITPMQLITAVCACTNGGNLMRPYLVKEVLDENGITYSQTQPEVVRQVVSADTSGKVREMLEKVVGDKVDGTGKNAYVPGYRVGGKTGTSEKVAQDAAGGPKEYIVSFLGVAPMDDPQIAILVLLDTPDEECGTYISGGAMGAPTVGNMMEDILPYMGVEAVYTPEEGALMDRPVPELTGKSLEEAKALLSSQGLSWQVIGGGGTVDTQLPSVGTIVAAESEVLLYAGAEPTGNLETMPDLTGLTYSIARQRLAFQGLYLKTNSRMLVNSQSQLVVVSQQSIEPDAEVEHGTVITVTLTDTDGSNNGRY